MTDEKEHPDGHLLAGDFFFFRVRDFDRARSEYEAAIKAFPKDKLLYQKRLVELDATTGDNANANQLLAGILKDNPKDSEAIAMRAALMLTTGNRDQINMAANDLQSLVTKNPDNYVLRFNLARALHAKNEDEQALLQLDAGHQAAPGFHEGSRIRRVAVHGARGQQQGAQGRRRDHRTQHQRRAGAPGAQRRAAERGRAGPGPQGTGLHRQDLPAKRGGPLSGGLFGLPGQELSRLRTRSFPSFLKIIPRTIAGLVGVTETLVAEKRVPDAIAEMDKAIALEPDRRDLKLFLANLDVVGERYDDAIKILQGLLDTAPKDAGLLFRLAETYRRKGDLNTAIDKFRLASQAAPNNTQPLLALALILDGTGRADQAQPIYEQILKIQPDHPVALNNLAYIKAEKGVDLEEALGMARRAQQKNPNSPDIQDTLGWIYIRKNLSEDAVRVFQDLVVKEPKNPIFHYHYGMALQEKGDKPSAKRELQKALDDGPSKPQEQQIRDLLQKLG